MKAVIIGNGEFPRKEYPRHVIREAGVIVCCDHGAERFLRASEKIFGFLRKPDVVVGDMDSISRSCKDLLSDRLVRIDEQDDNDQTKAFRYVLEHYPDVTEIHILGATGLREDHTVGNLGLLMEYARKYDLSGIAVDMISDYSTCFALTGTTELHVGAGRRVSIFSPDNSLKITSEGLQWQTSGVVFDNWWPATLNRAVEDVVTLSFSHPSIALVILD